MHELTLGKAALSEMTKSDNVKWFMHKVATTLEEQQFVLWIKNAKYGTFSNLKWFLFRRREASTCVLCDFFKAGCSDFKVQGLHSTSPSEDKNFLSNYSYSAAVSKGEVISFSADDKSVHFSKETFEKKKRKPKSNWTLCLNQPVSS